MKLALPGLALCGCSLLFVRGPEKTRKPVECTSSIIAPVLDMTLAGLNGYGALNAMQADQATWDANTHDAPRGAVIGVGIAVAVIWGISAVYGFKTTESCRAAEAADVTLKGPPPPPE